MFPKRGAVRDEGGSLTWTESPARRHEPEEGEPTLFDTSDWRPIPSSYDWYGALDPDGLVEETNPFSGAWARSKGQ